MSSPGMLAFLVCVCRTQGSASSRFSALAASLREHIKDEAGTDGPNISNKALLVALVEADGDVQRAAKRFSRGTRIHGSRKLSAAEYAAELEFMADTMNLER